MSNDELKRKAVHLAIDILINRGFRNAGFIKSHAAGMAAKWIVDNHGTDIWHFFTDTIELMTIIQKSKFRMEGAGGAREDYQLLQEKKARRIANKVIEKNG